jgi:hypothetical protein
MKQRCQVMVPIFPAPHDPQKQVYLHPTLALSNFSWSADCCNA